MGTDLADKSASQLINGYRARRFTPLEALDAVLARIQALEPVLNAFCVVDARRARRAARESTARWFQGRPVGSIDGVPMAIKDVTETKGWPTLNGSRAIDAAGPWREDAVAVERLRRHGAVLVGKTQTPEFAWRSITESELHGITRNPWNPEWTPGGSSGGAAAAVCAGMVAIATGTDSGGSIRAPASFCSIVGMKPTFGRVPVWPPSPLMMLEHCGPLARSVRDAALALGPMAGFDPRDGYALPEPAPDLLSGLERGVRGLRIGFSPDLGMGPVEPEVRRIVNGSKAVFTDLGARVTRVKLDLSAAGPAIDAICNPLAARIRRELGRRGSRLSNPVLIEAAESGATQDALTFLDGEAVRCRLRAQMAAFHTRYDLLIAPTVLVAPFAVGRDRPPGRDPRRASEFMATTAPFDLTGQPAISVPCGFTRAGGPVGLQIVGPLGRDALVLRAARAFEKGNSVGRRRPPR